MTRGLFAVVSLSSFYVLGMVLLAGGVAVHPASLVPHTGPQSTVPLVTKLGPGDNTSGNGTDDQGNNSSADAQGDNASVCAGYSGEDSQGENDDSQGENDQGNTSAENDQGTSDNTSVDSNNSTSGDSNGTGDNSTGEDAWGNVSNCSADPPVIFRAHGLPPGSTWSVTTGSPPVTISNTTLGHRGKIYFNVTDGVMNYTITPPSGYGIQKIVGPGHPSQTSDLINGTTILTVKFSVFENLTFIEKWLPPGSVWAVSIWSSLPHGGPAPQSGSNTTGPSGGSITFSVVKGPWKFNVSEIPANFTVHPHKGTVGVHGHHPVTRHLRFRPDPTTAPPALPATMAIATVSVSRLPLA